MSFNENERRVFWYEWELRYCVAGDCFLFFFFSPRRMTLETRDRREKRKPNKSRYTSSLHTRRPVLCRYHLVLRAQMFNGVRTQTTVTTWLRKTAIARQMKWRAKNYGPHEKGKRSWMTGFTSFEKKIENHLDNFVFIYLFIRRFSFGTFLCVYRSWCVYKSDWTWESWLWSTGVFSIYASRPFCSSPGDSYNPYTPHTHTHTHTKGLYIYVLSNRIPFYSYSFRVISLLLVSIAARQINHKQMWKSSSFFKC